MPDKQVVSKRKLEEPGDISVARAPAVPKKPKAASVAVAKKTRSATKQANSNDNNGQTVIIFAAPLPIQADMTNIGAQAGANNFQTR